MTFSKVRISALLAFTAIFGGGCADSTGPGDISEDAALQSLALGLPGFGGVGSPTSPQPNGSFGAVASLLDRVTVTIGGSAQEMFALGLRQSFPDGTCQEDVFVGFVVPSEPGACTPPALGLFLVLWQSHSALFRPDRMILLAADVGTSNFNFASTSDVPYTIDGTMPAFALYVKGEEVWGSLSGSLTSQVAATGETCNVDLLPPYAKSGVCNIATFDEEGSIVFQRFSFDDDDRIFFRGSSTERMNLVIPRQTLHGLWLSITEVQPVTPMAAGLTSMRGLAARVIGERLAAARLIPAR